MKQFAILLLAIAASAQTASAPKVEITPSQKKDMVIAYQRAIIAQIQYNNFKQQEQALLDDTNKAINEWNDLQATMRKELKLAEGSTFTPNLKTGEVVINPPTEAKKADPPK